MANKYQDSTLWDGSRLTSLSPYELDMLLKGRVKDYLADHVRPNSYRRLRCQHVANIVEVLNAQLTMHKRDSGPVTADYSSENFDCVQIVPTRLAD